MEELRRLAEELRCCHVRRWRKTAINVFVNHKAFTEECSSE